MYKCTVCCASFHDMKTMRAHVGVHVDKINWNTGDVDDDDDDSTAEVSSEVCANRDLIGNLLNYSNCGFAF